MSAKDGFEDRTSPLVVGPYELVRMIAQGGMGTIYQARQIRTGERCALKLLNSPGVNQDPALVRRLFREARACSVLDHEHVVSVFDSGIDQESGHAYIAMEFLPGSDLEKVIKQKAPLEPSVAARILLQAATGMAKAHQIGILHRDLKPANLFLSGGESGEVVVKILDFGVAKVRVEDSLDVSAGSLTRTGRLLGTPLYMSPEQVRNEGPLDARSDVWSLGVVLFEMLTGMLPYSRKQSFGDLMVSILSRDLPPLQDLAPWVDPKLAEIAHRAMSRSLELRYRDADKLREALAVLLSDGPALRQHEVQGVSRCGREQTATRLSSLSEDHLRVSTRELPVTPARAQSPRLRSLMIAGGLGVVSALALGLGAGSRTASTGSSLLSRIAERSPALPAPKQRTTNTYTVRVDPGVDVEVRGAPATVRNGQLALTGSLGETFAIRLRQGTRIKDVELVLLPQGPVPDTLELPKLGSWPSSRAPAHAGSAPNLPAADPVRSPSR